MYVIVHDKYLPDIKIDTYLGLVLAQGGMEARPGTEKRCSHNLHSGPVKTWTAVFVIINISDRHGST